MNHEVLYRLGQLSVIDVTGKDAGTIVHNLTTNQVTSLEVGRGNECFVTDVRGKTLGHVMLFRIDDSTFRMIGAGGQSERLAQHVDRYTIREDATPVIRDPEFVGFALSPRIASQLAGKPGEPFGLRWTPVSLTGQVNPVQVNPVQTNPGQSLAGPPVVLYGCNWLGPGSGILLVDAKESETILASLSQRLGTEKLETQIGEEASFHAARIAARFPWYGVDLDETNLPQEADRDDLSISFTKGCYLGQETVARLDAMGQVQKKLVVWSIQGGVPPAGTALQSGEKTVGRLTSVAPTDQGGAIALGPARRSHFEAGSVATGTIEAGSMESEPKELRATVI